MDRVIQFEMICRNDIMGRCIELYYRILSYIIALGWYTIYGILYYQIKTEYGAGIQS